MRKFDSVGGVVIMLKPLGTPPKLVNFKGLGGQFEDAEDCPFTLAKKTGEEVIATDTNRIRRVMVGKCLDKARNPDRRNEPFTLSLFVKFALTP
jgi:hypothetical protein